MSNIELPGRSPPVSNPDAPYCQICIEGGDSIAAEAYCTVCKEFQCLVCSNVHRRSRGTRTHQMLDKESMPSKTAGQDYELRHENYGEFCEEHPHELIKYFCPKHQTLHCGDCVVLNQYPCKLEVIAHVSVNFKDSSVYKDIKSKIYQLTHDVCEDTAELEKQTVALDDSEQKDKTQVHDFQSKVIAILNEKFRNITSQIAKKHQDSKLTLLNLQELSKENEAESTGLKYDIESNESNNVLLFISTYRSQTRANAISGKRQHIVVNQRKIPTYEFVPNIDLEAALESPTYIGIYRNSADAYELGSEYVCDDPQLDTGAFADNCPLGKVRFHDKGPTCLEVDFISKNVKLQCAVGEFRKCSADAVVVLIDSRGKTGNTGRAVIGRMSEQTRKYYQSEVDLQLKYMTKSQRSVFSTGGCQTDIKQIFHVILNKHFVVQSKDNRKDVMKTAYTQIFTDLIGSLDADSLAMPVYGVGGVDEMSMGAEWIWDSLVTVLTGLHAPPTRTKVISVICIDEKHYSMAGQVFKMEGKQLEML